MNLIFTSYVSVPEFNDPETWLNRINGYTGILESLSQYHTVKGIERINFQGRTMQKGVEYYFVRLRHSVVHFPWRMHRLIRKLQPHVVFINGFIFPLQIIQLRLTLGRGVKIIILHRAEKPMRGLRKYAQKLADQCVDAYLFTSLDSAQPWITKGIIRDKSKIREIIQGSSVFSPELVKTSSPGGCPVFLWVGRLDSNKDPLTVVKAFIRFLQWQPGAILYMIHQSNELLEEVQRLLETDGTAGDRIRLIGKVSHPALEEWYRRTDFIISGSRYEGSGIAVCEAMSCGCIPILTNIPPFRKMTGNGSCGWLYEAGNVKSLLEILIHTAGLDLGMERQKVLLQFREELSFEAIAKKINSVITSL
jgi:glycosyltransferase involved in cell wall biosynthesis